jgi:hypothetical protein
VRRVGFIPMMIARWGCSPDRLVGDDGLLEIKAPLPHTQVEYWISGEVSERFRQQLQGTLRFAALSPRSMAMRARSRASGSLGEKVGGLNRLGQQGTRPVAQHLGERVGERPWLKQLDDVSIGHGVSTPLLEKWRLEHPHDTSPSSRQPVTNFCP